MLAVVKQSRPVICSGTNPPKSRKSGAPTTSKGMNPEAPVFVSKRMVPTPPSSGEMTFAAPTGPPGTQSGPLPLPVGAKYQYRVPVQQPYYSRHVYDTHARIDGRLARQTVSEQEGWSVDSVASATPQQEPRAQSTPPTVSFADVPPHERFGVNITREVMALLDIEYRPNNSDGTPECST